MSRSRAALCLATYLAVAIPSFWIAFIDLDGPLPIEHVPLAIISFPLLAMLCIGAFVALVGGCMLMAFAAGTATYAVFYIGHIALTGREPPSEAP